MPVSSAYLIVMFVGLVPFLMIPAILAFASRHPSRKAIAGINLAVIVVAGVLAGSGVALGAVPSLLVWLGLFAWAIHGRATATTAATPSRPDA
jgi:hypothetical protein